MKKVLLAALLLLAIGALAACGSSESNTGGSASSPAPSAAPSASPSAEPSASPEASGTKTVAYLGESYELPASTERIVITGAVEAMEDSILLDLHPVGAISFSGKFPPLFASITDKAEMVGEKTEPNFEKILSLKPDVILASTKFDPAVVEKLKQIATVIPYSHVSTHWEDNLKLLGELSGKQAEAAAQADAFKADLEAAKTKLGDKLSGQSAAIVRIRQGEVYVYGKDLFFNPVLYDDLGFQLPEAIAAAKKQEVLSIEKLAEMNPDVLFVQFSEDENGKATTALDELQKNPIFQSLDAVKNGSMHVNLVDPLAQGGTAYSKVQFLKAFLEKAGS